MIFENLIVEYHMTNKYYKKKKKKTFRLKQIKSMILSYIDHKTILVDLNCFKPISYPKFI
jgi:hypothetical protein